MKVIASAAVSADGCLDDLTPRRLVLSGPEDWAEVHRLRAECDAILVGAETLRRDNPALVIRDSGLRAERIVRGQCPDLAKVTLSGTGNLPVDLRFFSEGEGEKIVFLPASAPASVRDRISEVSSVVPLPRLTARAVVEELGSRGFRSLLVEGGSHVLGLFFEENMVDEFRLAVAPFFVGQGGAPRLVTDGNYPFGRERRMALLEVRKVGDMAVMRYELKR